MERQSDQASRDEHIPHDDPQAKKEGEQNRKDMDAVPPHGTDPLHEGP